MTSDVCYLCAQEASVENLGSSFLVDCSRCGAYEIEAVATTIKLKDVPAVVAYLNTQRMTGSVRPLVFRELLITK